ncbi:Hypothetical protein AA314_00797 [Archangium gephyra]|uniref:DUF4440 domain-containing protein n=1 Tax=Archangium gephyra TaxID=48 RepID=A0AAC8Q1I5_9BACT|nr:Hypothetical protein AA314_00797 [Archangium gephyra]
MCVTAVALSGSAWAQDKEQKPAAQKPAEQKPAATSEQAAAMDMTAMGPGARKPTNEKQTKKEVLEFFKQQEELGKKGDFEGALAAYDFPVYMATDDLKGVPESREYSREEYAAMMKPFYENMPKDLKMTHKPTISVLSDSLVSVIDDFTMTQGKQKVTGRNTSLLVKRDGQWKWKVMVEAGYGGMSAEGKK